MPRFGRNARGFAAGGVGHPVGDPVASKRRRRGAALGSTLMFGLVVGVATTIAGPVAGAINVTQTNVGANVNCNLNGLHQGAGPVSTCNDISIQTQLLVNGSDLAAGSNLVAGDVVTVRMTVVTEGGQDSFYEETSDGLRNNETGGASDIQAYFNVSLPTQTGSQLSSPANVKMSRTDTGDRGDAPLINCLTQNGQEAAVSDSLTAITVGAAVVGGTDMKASLSGTAFRGTWDDMAWDRCRGVTFNNGIYPGHVLEFTQTVLSHVTSNQTLSWNLGQFTLARDDASRTITWGANAVRSFNVPGDADNDGVIDTLDTAPNDPCVPSNTAGACDRDGDGVINSSDSAPTDPCVPNIAAGTCDRDGDGVINSSDSAPTNACVPSVTAGTCDRDGDGVINSGDPAPTNACVPSNTVGACDRDGDGEINSIDTDDTDPCEDSGGLTDVAGCDDDGDGIPDGSVAGSNGIAGVNGGQLDSNQYNTCFPDPTSPLCAGAGSRFVKLTPKRIMDSRSGLGTTDAPFGAATKRDLMVAGTNGVPTNATAVVLNVTAASGTASTYLTVWPTGVTRPTASNVNTPAGVNRPNLVLATLGEDGKISIFNYAGSTEVIVDISGYFVPTTGAGFAPVTPKRVMDSRSGIGGPATDFTAGTVRDLTIAGANGVPGTATAAVVNITAVNATASSYLTAYPKGATRPTASNVNWTAGVISPNMAIVPLGTGGAISVYNYAGNVDVLIDVVGYFDAAANGNYRPLTPSRFFDSRSNLGTAGGDWAAGETRTQPIRGSRVPSIATGFAGNLTAPNPAAVSYMTVWPDGLSRPVVSNLNVATGDTRANAVIGGIGGSGNVKVFNYAGSNHLLLDVSGWFGPMMAMT